MNTFELVALVVLALIAAVLVVMAAVRTGRARRPAPGAMVETSGPKWHEILLAVVLLAVLVVVAIMAGLQLTGDGAASGDWRAGTRANMFLAVMLAAAALSLLFLVVFLATRLTARSASISEGAQDAARLETAKDPAGSRLLGLLLLVIGFLLIGWIYLSPEARADLLMQVIYPAAIAVAIVLLFDKATRSWTPKPRVEGFREWLLCDVLVITLVLGYLNLRHLGDHAAYGGFFWDMVHIAAVFLVFWFVDRTSVPVRFLVGFGYLTVAPLLLVLWGWVQEIEAPPEPDWWSTVWPVFFLALVFFVLEIIALLALRGGRGHVVPAVKDVVFVILYAVLLIVAVPGGA